MIGSVEHESIPSTIRQQRSPARPCCGVPSGWGRHGRLHMAVLCPVIGVRERIAPHSRPIHRGQRNSPLARGSFCPEAVNQGREEDDEPYLEKRKIASWLRRWNNTTSRINQPPVPGEVPAAVRYLKVFVQRPLFWRGETKIVNAVTDISFTVQRGEIFGILGANGSGKSR